VVSGGGGSSSGRRRRRRRLRVSVDVRVTRGNKDASMATG